MTHVPAPQRSSRTTGNKQTRKAIHTAINTALLASAAALAMGGCGSAKTRTDHAALEQVEATISKVRPAGAPAAAPASLSGEIASKSAAYASTIDAALQAPDITAKIQAVKSGSDIAAVTPAHTKAEKPHKSDAAHPPEARTETSKTAPTPPQVVLASHGDVETRASAEPKPARAEPVHQAKPGPSEPDKTPAGAIAKLDTARPEPAKAERVIEKIEKPAPIQKAETPEKTEPAAMSSAVALATIDSSNKAITAMGSMAAAGTAVVADEAVKAADVTPGADAPSMDAIVAQLRRQVAANPRQLNVALALQLLAGDSKTAGADAGVSGLSEADQKIVADVSAAVQSIMQVPATAPLAERAAPLTAASAKWAAESDLNLPRLVLASRVDSYGVYTPVEAKFENGKRHTVIIYCEVANFAARKSDDGWFTTRLAQQDSLITEDGLLVWRPNPEEVEDRSRNQRRDFYLVKKLAIPETLAIGKYTLRMSVTDKQTNKIAMMSIPVEIVAR